MKALYVIPRMNGDATEYSFKWWMPVRKKASSVFAIKKELLEDDATRDNFLKELPKFDYISHVDHGRKNALGGQNKEILVNTEDADLFKDKIFNTFSCSSGKEFCPALINAGCKAAHGFTGVVGFTTIDKDARQFGKYFTSFEMALLDGSTYKEAYKVSQKKAKKVCCGMSMLGKIWLTRDAGNETTFGDLGIKVVDKKLSLLDRIKRCL